MSLTCIHQVALENTIGTSDKLYVIQVQQDAATGEYQTVAYSGRRGSSLVTQPKYKGPSEVAALKEVVKVETSKRKGGYTVMSVRAGSPITGMPAGVPVWGGASAASTAMPAVAISAATGPKVMLAQVAPESELQKFIDDKNWVAQKKYDGERVTVSLSRAAIQAYNRKGIARPLTDVAHKELTELLALTDFSNDRTTVLDGELMGDTYVVYDVLMMRDNDTRSLAYDERYGMLELLLDGKPHMLAPTGWTADEKDELRNSALRESWEGLMFRKLEAGYDEGRSSNLLKCKLWATATCRVLAVNTQRSVQLGLLNEHLDEVFVGNVTVPVNQDIPELDALVEVRYLYAMDGGSLYQPTLLRVRDDVDTADSRDSLQKAPPEKR